MKNDDDCTCPVGECNSSELQKGLDKIENAVEKAGEDQSQAIIDFNNNFLDSYKSTSRHVENIVEYAEAAVKNLKEKPSTVCRWSLTQWIIL